MTANDAIKYSHKVSLEKTFYNVVKSYLPQQRWLGKNNHYKDKTIDKIKNNVRNPGANPVNHKHLAEYIASSTVLHCFAGWNYISRSIESLLNNDIPSCIHFAYYGELRAAMSLLATEGIGVFDNFHFFIDTNQDCREFRGSKTHKMTDELINLWAQEPVKKEQIFNIIRVRNKNISDWFRDANYSISSSYASDILKDWLVEWSMDLKFIEDQYLRNEMSYRPHFKNHYLDIKTAISTVKDIWQGLEPTNDHRFQELDLHLFRIALEKAFSKFTGVKTISRKYALFIDKMFANAGEPTNQYFYNFLLRSVSDEDHVLLINARSDRNKNRIGMQYPFAIISRGILLLRLASGLCDSLIKNTGLTINVFKFWWEEIAFEMGLIPSRPYMLNSIDLFADVVASFNNIEFNDVTLWTSTKNVNNIYSSELQELKQFQRVGIWGLGL